MQIYCTYFDSNFLSRGLALYASLQRHTQPFQLWVLCMDDEVYAMLHRINVTNLIPVKLSQLEAFDCKLCEIRSSRTQIEYYFTCTASWMIYVLKQSDVFEIVTYLDADLYFFANPQPLFDELGHNSALIIEHRFPKHLQHLEIYGLYNVGWISIRNNQFGHNILQWWRDRCLEWCYDGFDGERFADQKYLDAWPDLFEGVVVSRCKGANLAPWNIGQYDLEEKDGILTVDQELVLFYHFHHFNYIAPMIYCTGLESYKTVASQILLRKIYGPYLRELKTVVRRTRQFTSQPIGKTVGKNRFAQQGNLFDQLRSSRFVVTIGPITTEVYPGSLKNTCLTVVRPVWHTLRMLQRR